jgi:hypothetical protein
VIASVTQPRIEEEPETTPEGGEELAEGEVAEGEEAASDEAADGDAEDGDSGSAES